MQDLVFLIVVGPLEEIQDVSETDLRNSRCRCLAMLPRESAEITEFQMQMAPLQDDRECSKKDENLPSHFW